MQGGFGELPLSAVLKRVGMSLTMVCSVTVVSLGLALSEPTPAAAQSGSVGGLGSGVQGNDCQPAKQPLVTPDSSLNQVIAGQTGPGWLGGDSTYSTPLPDGQESFVFSDTLTGTIQRYASTRFTGIPHNSELVGDLPNLTADFGGDYGGRPQSLIPDQSPGAFWWTGSTYVENGVQLIYVNEYRAVPGNSFGRSTGHSGIAVMSLSSRGQPKLRSITALPTDPRTTWGSAVLHSGPFVYVYGLVRDPSSGTYYGMKVARVRKGLSLTTSAWTYWNGAKWVPGERSATIINPGTILTGVAPQAGSSGFVGVSIPGGSHRGASVALSYACSPTGPWSSLHVIYTIPQIREYQGEIAYTPTFHPELSQRGLVVSYNINNPSHPGRVLENVHEYRPQFLLLKN